MGRFDHNMAGLENGENNSEPTLKEITCVNSRSGDWIEIVNDRIYCVLIMYYTVLQKVIVCLVSWVMYIATHLMYLGKCNLYGKVIEFRKQEQHSENFKEIPDWLQDLIKLCENSE